MTWHPTAPDGTVSVQANRTILGDNTTYTEITMGNNALGTNISPNTSKDHFWNVSETLDGYHRTINMPVQPQHILKPNVDISAIMYLMTVNTGGGVQLFYNQGGSGDKYQITPGISSVNNVVGNSYSSITTAGSIPPNVYGEIFGFTPSALGSDSVQTGYFRSNGSTVEAWSIAYERPGDNDQHVAVKFANGADASGLNILAKVQSASAGQTWSWRFTWKDQ